MAYNPFESNSKAETSDESRAPLDDLEIPEGEDLNFDEMTATIDTINTTVSQDVNSSDTAGPTPLTPRPVMPPSQDSQAPFIPISPVVTRSTAPHQSHETSDDPNDDVMSMNTDINRHDRALTQITQQMREISNKIDMIPDIDSKIRMLSKSNAEMESRFARISQELENMRKSFNMYQSSTANKIADVERRAAEHQLTTQPTLDSGLIPPAEIHSVRDQVPDMGRQSDTVNRSAVEVPPKKKKAVVADW
jgi:hypothetical protein